MTGPPRLRRCIVAAAGQSHWKHFVKTANCSDGDHWRRLCFGNTRKNAWLIPFHYAWLVFQNVAAGIDLKKKQYHLLFLTISLFELGDKT